MKKSELQSSLFPNLLNIRFNNVLWFKVLYSIYINLYSIHIKRIAELERNIKKIHTQKSGWANTFERYYVCDIWSKNYPFPCRRIYRSEEERNVAIVRNKKKKLCQLHKNEVEGGCGHEYEKHDILRQCYQEEIQSNRTLAKSTFYNLCGISPNYFNNTHRTNLCRQ